VEESAAHNQHPSAEPSRQRFLGHKGNHRYLASIELIDAAENGWLRSCPGIGGAHPCGSRCLTQLVIPAVLNGWIR
jgi:hypothetical protein